MNFESALKVSPDADYSDLAKGKDTDLFNYDAFSITETGIHYEGLRFKKWLGTPENESSFAPGDTAEYAHLYPCGLLAIDCRGDWTNWLLSFSGGEPKFIG